MLGSTPLLSYDVEDEIGTGMIYKCLGDNKSLKGEFTGGRTASKSPKDKVLLISAVRIMMLGQALIY